MSKYLIGACLLFLSSLAVAQAVTPAYVNGPGDGFAEAELVFGIAPVSPVRSLTARAGTFITLPDSVGDTVILISMDGKTEQLPMQSGSIPLPAHLPPGQYKLRTPRVLYHLVVTP